MAEGSKTVMHADLLICMHEALFSNCSFICIYIDNSFRLGISIFECQIFFYYTVLEQFRSKWLLWAFSFYRSLIFTIGICEIETQLFHSCVNSSKVELKWDWVTNCEETYLIEQKAEESKAAAILSIMLQSSEVLNPGPIEGLQSSKTEAFSMVWSPYKNLCWSWHNIQVPFVNRKQNMHSLFPFSGDKLKFEP